MVVSVVYGGTVEERIASGQNAADIAEVLSSRGYDVKLIEFGNDIIAHLKSIGTEIVFLCVQGKGYGDGTFQAMLEHEGIPFTGSGMRQASLINDKILCKLIFDKCGIRTPKWAILDKKTYEAGTFDYEGLGYPFVAKAPTQGGSYGIELINSASDLELMKNVFIFDNPILLETFIPGNFYTVGLYEKDGEIVTLPVVQGVDLGDKERKAAEVGNGLISFTGSYGIKESTLPKEIEDEMQKMSQRIFTITGARDVARVDIMQSDVDNKPYVLEINAVPGLKKKSLLPKEAALAGIEYGDLIEDILKSSLRRI